MREGAGADEIQNDGSHLIALQLLDKEGLPIVPQLHVQIHWLPIDLNVHLQYEWWPGVAWTVL
jgi:hypothetical protein